MAKRTPNLPGNFNLYPKGAKPPHYAPRDQPDIASPPAWSRAPHDSISGPTGITRMPHDNISAPTGITRMPHHTIAPPAAWSRSPHNQISEPVAWSRTPHNTISAPPVQDREDPWGNYYFSLELDKEEVANFQECSGLKTQSEIFAVEEGGKWDNTHSLPGASKWATLTLKAMMTSSPRLIEWRDSYLTEKGWQTRPTTTAAIVIRDNDGTELRRFTLMGVWPISWDGGQLSGAQSSLASETLEIAFDHVVLGDPSAPVPPPPAPDVPEVFAPPPIQFAKNSAELTPAGEEALRKTSEQLDQHPEIQTVYVEAHSCDLGSEDQNKDLSQRRADVCAKSLQKRHPEKKVEAKGFAWNYPVAPNNGEPGRSRNRRTQIFTEPRSGKRGGELDYVKYPGK